MGDRAAQTQNIAVLEPGYADYDTEVSLLGKFGGLLVPVAEHVDAVSTLQTLNPVAILVRERAVRQPEIDACPNLKIIVRYGVGVDNIDVQYANDRDVYVANVPNYGAEKEVSEHALALYLAVQRRIPSRDREVRGGLWGIGQAAPIPSREGAVLGLIGCGRIGLEVARKFRALGIERTIVYDPFLDATVAQTADVELVDLDTICAQADIISLHAPLTPATRHILDAERIALMKPTSIVVNVSRGGLVDEQALAQALNEGRLFGAGIDVFEQEPVRETNPLLAAPNTVLSDHAAWYSERSVQILQRKAAEEIARALQGIPPISWVNEW